MGEILLLDSGIDINNKEFNCIGGINFLSGNKEDINDKNGHGTNCAYIIKKYYNEAEFVIGKILNENARTSSFVLMEALEYALFQKVKVINLSAATTDNRYKEDMMKICNKLYEQGIVIIASLTNRAKSSYPACFDSAIGIEGIYMNESLDYWYDKNKAIQCVADLTPIMVDDLNGNFRMFGGNSKATAIMTSIIAKNVYEKENSLEDLNEVLQTNAIRTDWNLSEIEMGKEIPIKYIGNDNKIFTKKELEKIVDVFVRIFKIPSGKQGCLYQNNIYNYLKTEDYFILMKEIEKEFNITVDYKNLKYEIFYSLYSLAKFIYNR